MSLFHNSALAGASGQSAGGYDIERSVRFNSSDSAYLSRTMSSASSTYTLSMWVKRSAIGTSNRYLFSSGNAGLGIRFTSGAEDLYVYNGATATYSNVALRDLSAWYHIVFSVNSLSATIYVNNSAILTGASAAALSTTSNASSIGRYYSSGSGGAYFDGYLADVHFIDGQALDPTSFGEFDTNGIWQPIEYTGSFGTNGFHLPFSDNSTAAALGTDTSGNGNDWTVNNLAVGGSTVYAGTGSAAVSGSVPNGGTPYWIDIVPTTADLDYFEQAGYMSRVHDGSLSTFVYWTGDQYAGDGNVTRARFDLRDFTSVTSVRVHASSIGLTAYTAQLLDSGKTAIGGTSVSLSASSLQWFTVPVSGSPRYIEFSCTSGTLRRLELAEIEVNGVVLAQNSADDDSLVDVPTNGTQTDTGVGGEVTGNYCVNNSLDTGAITFANGNLDLSRSSSGWEMCRGTIGVTNGKWYWEVTVTTAAYIILGAARSSAVLSSSYPGGDSNGWGWASYAATKYNGSSGISYGSATSNGDIVGIALDLDSATITFYKNGVSQGAAFTNVNNGPIFPAIAVNGLTASSCVVNFGQRPFAYQAPSGYKALNTANLPAPVITKPSEYMDVKLYTGNGSTQTISGLEFSPDLVWIKSRVNPVQGYFQYLHDSVRGSSSGFLRTLNSNTTDAEDTYPGSTYGGVSALNSDGFSLTNAGTNYFLNNNATPYAAWCWDAGGEPTTDNVAGAGNVPTAGSAKINGSNLTTALAGSIPATRLSANTSAGFSIVTYTGTGSNATIGHGLGVAPSLIIGKARSISQVWVAGHTSIGWGNYLLLNATDASASGANVWNSTAPTSTVFSIGTGTGLNTSSATYVAYCFAPVAGYSSFGSYVGNGSSDGPFVYTGFRPKWVLVKMSSGTSSWQLLDSARSDINVMDDGLFPNLSNAETAASAYNTDFLSNGFKIRDADSFRNGNGSTFIYCAFAESPFQYARAR